MDAKTEDTAGKCPFTGGARGRRNRDWWPDALDVSVLHRNSELSDPMGKDFDYAAKFKALDLDAIWKAAQTLPAYAQPRFLRHVNALSTTSTHKIQKQGLRSDGVDPGKVPDPLFVRTESAYVPLTPALWGDIMLISMQS